MMTNSIQLSKVYEEIIIFILLVGFVLWLFKGGDTKNLLNANLNWKSIIRENNIFNSTNFEHPKRKKRSYYKREEKCRNILQKYFGRRFIKIKPKWLIYPKTGRKLELDGYCKELRLAFEYNGAQHYYYNPYHYKNRNQFKDQVSRDKWKYKRCKELGINVIIIPFDLQEEEIENYIFNQLDKFGY